MSLFRNLKLHWRRWRDLQTMKLDGVVLTTAPDLVPRSIRSAIFKETYEAHERRLAQEILVRGDRVLEVGAGIGLMSLLSARICGAGNVLAYEANPALEPVIKANHVLNAFAPKVRMRAVTLEGGPLRFFRSDNIVSSSSTARAGAFEEIEVQSDAIDKVIEEWRPTVVIMDVEGAEIELLSNARLDGVRHIVVETHDHITGPDAIDRMIAALAAKRFRTAKTAHKTVCFSREA